MSDEKRVDPDELLTALKHHEAAERRGHLKIFFGAVPRVRHAPPVLIWSSGTSNPMDGWKPSAC
jgi:hypothetical protein